jgi:hypothetical protein
MEQDTSAVTPDMGKPSDYKGSDGKLEERAAPQGATTAKGGNGPRKAAPQGKATAKGKDGNPKDKSSYDRKAPKGKKWSPRGSKKNDLIRSNTLETIAKLSGVVDALVTKKAIDEGQDVSVSGKVLPKKTDKQDKDSEKGEEKVAEEPEVDSANWLKEQCAATTWSKQPTMPWYYQVLLYFAVGTLLFWLSGQTAAYAAHEIDVQCMQTRWVNNAPVRVFACSNATRELQVIAQYSGENFKCRIPFYLVWMPLGYFLISTALDLWILCHLPAHVSYLSELTQTEVHTERSDDYSMLKGKHRHRPHLVVVKRQIPSSFSKAAIWIYNHYSDTDQEVPVAVCASLAAQMLNNPRVFKPALDHKDNFKRALEYVASSSTVFIPQMPTYAALDGREYPSRSLVPFDVRLNTAQIASTLYQMRLVRENSFSAAGSLPAPSFT